MTYVHICIHVAISVIYLPLNWIIDCKKRRASDNKLRQSVKTIKSQDFSLLQPHTYSFEINLNLVNRDISPSSN